MARRGGQKYLVAFVLGTALYISLLNIHVQALQLVRNGIPYRARDEVQFLAPNVSVEAPEGLEIDRNAPPTRVEVPIDVEIQKQDDMAGKVALKPDRYIEQVLAAKNATSTTTTTKPTTISKLSTTAPTGTTPNKTKKDTEHFIRPDAIADPEPTERPKRNSASGLLNSHSFINIAISMSLAILVANKMFFI